MLIRADRSLRHLTISAACLLLLAGVPISDVSADPPPWAPAHGYRSKHKHRDRDYHRDRHYDYEPSYRNDYFGVLDGHCNHETIGTVLGGAIGGAVGAHTASREDRALGTIAGVVIGAVLGNVVGRSMDDADRYCTGHVLEYVDDHHTVQWANPRYDLQYAVTPVYTRRLGDRYCREFIVRTERHGRVDEDYSRACRTSRGTWQIVN